VTAAKTNRLVPARKSLRTAAKAAPPPAAALRMQSARATHLEARALARARLLLHRHDLHHLVLEGGAQKVLHDLVLLDGHGEQVDGLQALDLALWGLGCVWGGVGSGKVVVFDIVCPAQ